MSVAPTTDEDKERAKVWSLAEEQQRLSRHPVTGN